MDKLVIEGGRTLEGPLEVSGSKNTALALMAGAMMGEGPSSFSNVPSLRDINTFSQVIGFTGTEVDFSTDTHTLSIDPERCNNLEAPYELVKKMRASFYMLGALLGRFGKARVSLPGGCAWGPRPVDLHIQGMKALGASVELDAGYVVAHAPDGRLRGGYFKFEPSSVGATINLLLAAVLARGYSRLENAAIEPDVVVFGEALQKMGARIDGLGTRVIEVYGVDSLKGISFVNCPDRIELGTFMILAALAGTPSRPVDILNGRQDHLGERFISSFEQTGATAEYETDRVRVTAPEEVQPVSVTTDIYPGFPTDLQAQWTVLMARAHGNSRIKESIYADRFKHIPELRRLGINAIVIGNEVVIEGGSRIRGAKVMSTDLRASVSLVLAGLVADGTTEVLRVYHLDRGYEDLEGKLSSAGLQIERESYNEWAEPVPKEA